LLLSLLMVASAAQSIASSAFVTPRRMVFGLEQLRSDAQPSIAKARDTKLNSMVVEIPERVRPEVQEAPVVTGAQLKAMLGDWEGGPLVIEAFTTWCKPCMRMSEDYDAAARELNGRVRFVKLDVERDPWMARRLEISSVPTILFVDHSEAEEDSEEKRPKAFLREKLVGSLGKDTIKALCEQNFFHGQRIDEL